MVNASSARVWKTLTDIAHWPDWNRGVLKTTIAQPAATDVSFRWTVSGGTISSKIVLFEPDHRLAWTGQFLIFRAIHVWSLDALPGGGTAVTTTESLSGWPVAWLISSSEIEDTDRRWLAALKQKVEA